MYTAYFPPVFKFASETQRKREGKGISGQGEEETFVIFHFPLVEKSFFNGK
jgi:hypothetical protein